MLWWVGLAAAHVPHDTMLSLVAPADGDPSVPWFVILDPQGVYLWARSDDAGATWTLIGGPPLAEDLLGAARLDDGTIGILGAHHLWTSTDDSATWTATPRPGRVDHISGGSRFVLAGDGGLFVGLPGAWATVTDAPIVRFGPGAAWAPSEGVWAQQGPTWVRLDNPAQLPESVAADGEAYAGFADGSIARWSEAGWADCAALPDPVDPLHDNVVQLTVAEGSVFAATGGAGPYVADGACTAWSDAALTPFVIDYGSDGGATSEQAAWGGIARLDGHTAIWGWAGFGLRDDTAARWTTPQLIPPDYTRGIAFARNFPRDPQLYVGAYASGVQRTADGGLSWDAPNHGIGTTNVQWIVASPAEDDVVYAVVNHVGRRSVDAGVTWTEFTPGGGSTAMIWPRSKPGHAFVQTRALYETEDAGESWTERKDIGSLLAGASVAGIAESGGTLCLTAYDPDALFCSGDGGHNWTQLGTGARSGGASAPKLWPPDAPTRVVWVDHDGAHSVGLDGTDAAEDPLEALTELAVTADGTLVAGATSGLLYRSDDGGRTWAATAVRLPAHIHVMAPRPDWATHPELLVGTHDGVYVVTLDGAATRLAYQRVDDSSAYLDCTGCAPAIADPAAALETVHTLPEGATMTTQVRGNRLTIAGSASEGAAFALRVDDAEETVGPLPATQGVLVARTMDTDGPHTVTLTGLGGPEVRIDYLESFGEGAILTLPDPSAPAQHASARPLPPGDGRPHRDPPDAPCGCASSPGAVLFTLPWLRRRRDNPPRGYNPIR